MNTPTPEQLAKGQGTMNDTLITATMLQALAATGAQPARVGGHVHVIVPPGYVVRDITDVVEKAQSAPNRKFGTVAVKDVASLLAYCADQAQTERGYIYADTDKRSLVAVFNDQRGAATPGWRDHRASFVAEYTPEFETWLRNNKQPKDQTQFAEFIEDNAADIENAQTLLDVASTLQAKTGIDFKSSKRLDNGQAQLSYVEVIDAKAGADGSLTIPKEFNLAVRIFKNGQGYRIKARLKYRLSAGGIKFWYELDRPERSVEDAFAGYVQQVRDASGYVVLLGAA